MISLSSRVGKRVWAFVALYMLAYLVASYMDLATTTAGLQRPGVYEKNVFATNAAGYSPLRAWLLTAGGAVIMFACILFAARHSSSVADRWLQHPIRSFGKAYLNPWSKSAISVSPLHMLSLVIAFVFLRVIAAANNLSIFLGGFGPMGETIKAVAARTSPVAGFCIVVLLCFLLTTMAAAPLAARIIATWRTEA